jgi:hypothetical protein
MVPKSTSRPECWGLGWDERAEDTGEPFCIIYSDYYNPRMYFFAPTAGNHTFNVCKVTEILQRLPEKYLPESYPYSTMKTTAETRYFTPMSSEGGYIDDMEFAKLLYGNLDKATYTYNGIESVIYRCDDISCTLYRSAGNTNQYRVELVTDSDGNLTGRVWFGDQYFSEGSVTIPKVVETIHCLDEKFIPDTIARTSDILDAPSDWNASEGESGHILKFLLVQKKQHSQFFTSLHFIAGDSCLDNKIYPDSQMKQQNKHTLSSKNSNYGILFKQFHSFSLWSKLRRLK